MSTLPTDRAIPLDPVTTPDGRSDGNLPAPLISLIGRTNEIEEACALLGHDGVRLVTFTGPGGVGKTQLALAVARKLGDCFEDGASLVQLAPVSDPEFVAPAIAQALNVRDRGTLSLVESLRATIGLRNVLLVLDNFEHLLEASPLVVELLSGCPHLKVLATSRALLHVSGEHAFSVPPLDVPHSTQSISTADLLRYEAVDLFVTRAREMNPDFALSESNGDAVATICRSLDGLPLAIELAAARTRVLSAQALCAQMSDRLPVLTGGRRDAPDRLQTMRQAIAWSYDLLSPSEQALFCRLSVFAGGFTLDDAEAVTGDQSVLDHLTSLVDKSLVRQQAQPDGETRFSMLETIREYGTEQLTATGEENELKARHARHFLEVAERADQLPQTAAKALAGRKLEAVRPNFRAALTWADETHNAELMLRLSLALYWFWESRGSLEEAGAWYERTISATKGAPKRLRGRRARVLTLAGYCAAWQGNQQRAELLTQDAASLARDVRDARALAFATLSTGYLAICRSDWDRATTYLMDALAQMRALNDPDGIMTTLNLLGFVAGLRGKSDAARHWFEEGLAVAQACGALMQIAFGLEALGTCAREQGDLKRAVPLFTEALSIVQDGSDLATLANCLKSLGAVAAVAGNAQQAARLFGAADALRYRAGIGEQVAAEQVRLEQAYAPARARLSAEAFAAAWSVGREMPLDQAISEALDVARDFESEQPVSPEPQPGLTARELDVLRLLVEGLADKEIAEALGMSRRTASKHVEIILSKLQVSSRTAAATYATRHKLI